MKVEVQTSARQSCIANGNQSSRQARSCSLLHGAKRVDLPGALLEGRYSFPVLKEMWESSSRETRYCGLAAKLH